MRSPIICKDPSIEIIIVKIWWYRDRAGLLRSSLQKLAMFMGNQDVTTCSIVQHTVQTYNVEQSPAAISVGTRRPLVHHKHTNSVLASMATEGFMDIVFVALEHTPQ